MKGDQAGGDIRTLVLGISCINHGYQCYHCTSHTGILDAYDTPDLCTGMRILHQFNFIQI